MKLQKCLGKKISYGSDCEYVKCRREGFSLMVCDLYIHLIPELVPRRKIFLYSFFSVSRAEAAGSTSVNNWRKGNPTWPIVGAGFAVSVSSALNINCDSKYETLKKLSRERCCEFRCKVSVKSRNSLSFYVFLKGWDHPLLFSL